MALEARAAPPLRDVLCELTLGEQQAAAPEDATTPAPKATRKHSKKDEPVDGARPLPSFCLCTGGSSLRVWDIVSGSVKLNLNFASKSTATEGQAGTGDSGGSKSVQQVSALALCTARGTESSSKGSKPTTRGRRSKASESTSADGGEVQQLLAVGLESGMLEMWDVRSAQQKWAAVAHNGAIGCLARAPGGVLSGGRTDGTVAQWALGSGERLRTVKVGKSAVARLAVYPLTGLPGDGAVTMAAGLGKGFLLAMAARQLTVWHVPAAGDVQKVGRFSGHKESTGALCFSPRGNCLVSGGQGECQLVLWRLSRAIRSLITLDRNEETELASAVTQAVAEARGSKSAETVLPLPAPAVAVHVCGVSTAAVAGECFDVVALTETGVACIGRASGSASPESMEGQQAPRSTQRQKQLSNGSKDAVRTREVSEIRFNFNRVKNVAVQPAPPPSVRGSADVPTIQVILGASLMQTLDGGNRKLLVAFGPLARPQFQEIDLIVEEDADEDKDAHLLPYVHHGSLAKDLETRRKAGSGTPSVVDVEHQSAPILAPVQVREGVTPKSTRKRRAEDDGEDAGNGGEMMNEEEPKDGPTLGEMINRLDITEGKLTAQNTETTEPLPASADSLAVLLSQALQADDASMLERCLNVTDARVVSNTVRRLQAAEAVKFLDATVTRLRGRPGRAEPLTVWIKSVLLTHTSALINMPSAQNSLAEMYQILEARMSLLQPLLALQGRLDLLANCMASSSDSPSLMGDDERVVPVFEVGEAMTGREGNLVVDEEDEDEWEEDDVGDGEWDDEDEEGDDGDEDGDEDMEDIV